MISVDRLDIRIAQRIGKGIKKKKILYWFGVYRIRLYQPGYWVSNSSLKRNTYVLQTFTTRKLICHGKICLNSFVVNLSWFQSHKIKRSQKLLSPVSGLITYKTLTRAKHFWHANQIINMLVTPWHHIFFLPFILIFY